MNKTVTVGTLLSVLLVTCLLASSGLAVNYYQVAAGATARAMGLEAKGKELEGQLSQANRILQDTRTQLQDALKRLGITQEQLKATRGELGQTQGQLGKTQGQLRATQSSLGQTQSQLSQAQQESQRRLQMIFAQQENVKILKTCLAGVVVSQHYYTKGMDHYLEWTKSPNNYDYDEAIKNFKAATAIMKPVRGDCDRAYDFFK